jgi:hypothetical protein
MEPQSQALEMQQEMIREIERAQPEYVVFVHVNNSWLQNAASNPLIFDWFLRYQRDNLEMAGLVEIQPDEPTRYRWFDPPQTNAETSAESWLTVFKRRSNEPAPAESK